MSLQRKISSQQFLTFFFLLSNTFFHSTLVWFILFAFHINNKQVISMRHIVFVINCVFWAAFGCLAFQMLIYQKWSKMVEKIVFLCLRVNYPKAGGHPNASLLSEWVPSVQLFQFIFTRKICTIESCTKCTTIINNNIISFSLSLLFQVCYLDTSGS